MKLILSGQEKQEFVNPPKFNSEQRKKYYALPVVLMKKFNQNKTTVSKVIFILQYGYLKARGSFYTSNFDQKDIDYICNRYNLDKVNIEETYIYSSTQVKHQDTILKFLGYADFNNYYKDLIQKEIYDLLQFEHKPKVILYKIVEYLRHSKVEVPTLHKLTAIIRNQIINHKNKLGEMVLKHLTPAAMISLDSLTKKDKNTDSQVKYPLTSLKIHHQSTKTTKIIDNVEYQEKIQLLFHQIKNILPHLPLRDEGIDYYAQMTQKYPVTQLEQLSIATKYLHLIAFIAHKYYYMEDLLIITYLKGERSITNSVKREYKNYLADNKDKFVSKLQELVVNSIDNKGILFKLIKIINSNDTYRHKFNRMKAVILDNIEQLKEFARIDTKWQELETDINDSNTLIF